MPQHVRGDNLGPVRLGHANGLEQAPTATRDLRGLRPGSGRPCPGCRHGLLSRTECACASIAYGVRRRADYKNPQGAQLIWSAAWLEEGA
jgi:hypothetical protein